MKNIKSFNQVFESSDLNEKKLYRAKYSIEDGSGDGPADWKRYIDAAKIPGCKVETAHSAYKHHKGLTVEIQKKSDAAKVIKALRNYGIDWPEANDFEEINESAATNMPVEFNDYIKSNARDLENSDNVTDDDIEDLVTAFLGKSKGKQYDRGELVAFAKEYFGLDESAVNENYGQVLDKLQKAFDGAVEEMRGSSVMENGPKGIWIDLGVRNQFCDENGKLMESNVNEASTAPVHLTIMFGKDQAFTVDNIIDGLKKDDIITKFERKNESKDGENYVVYEIDFVSAYGVYLFGHQQGSLRIMDQVKQWNNEE